MRIVFWGTPAFSLLALRAILGEGHEVVGVVTQPDRPAGRGHALRPPPVKRLAQEEMIPVLQPERAAGPRFLAELKALQATFELASIVQLDLASVPAAGRVALVGA